MEEKKKVDKGVVLNVMMMFSILVLLIFINQNKQRMNISKVKNLSDGTEFRMKVRIAAFVNKTSVWTYQVSDNTGCMDVNFSEAQRVGSEIELVAKKYMSNMYFNISSISDF